ncbi:MAG TPA: hemerythrin domain-containing protein [Acidimicrobiales bacterium]|jgi:hemerythrin superfamily protein|nr:hemerythrin domain-containing protein [Acidimicrobiales bacterium]
MPDPVMQLIEQHNRLRRLFKQVPRMGGHQAADERALAICEIYTVHTRLEEDVIYPVIRRLDSAMADEAAAAHDEGDALVEAMQAADYANNGEVKRDLAKLEQIFENHARWEEDELLPKISALDTEEFDRLGSALYERNQELLKENPGALDVSAETEGFIASPRI